MAERITLEDFVPHCRTRFRVARLESCELELTEATDHSNEQLEQFSLIFTGALSPWLPQGSYKLTHPSMGECELFLVPLGPDAMGMRYEAAFSRVKSAMHPAFEPGRQALENLNSVSAKKLH
jgi:hypothetical protein